MPRIDLFTSPDCPSCPRAREAVAAFVAENPEIEVREWDFATDPGPAAGRGIFATPSLLFDGASVFLGVPTQNDLLAHFGHRGRSAVGARRVLVLNAYQDFLRRPVFECLSRAGYVPCTVDSIEAAVEALRTRAADNVVVALNPTLGPEGRIEGSGISLWARILGQLGDPWWATHPIVVTATSPASAPLVRSELERHRIANPVLVATKAEVLEPGFHAAIQRHLEGQRADARSDAKNNVVRADRT